MPKSETCVVCGIPLSSTSLVRPPVPFSLLEDEGSGVIFAANSAACKYGFHILLPYAQVQEIQAAGGTAKVDGDSEPWRILFLHRGAKDWSTGLYDLASAEDARSAFCCRGGKTREIPVSQMDIHWPGKT